MRKKLLASFRVMIAALLMIFATNFGPVIASVHAYSLTNPDDTYKKVYVCKYVGTPGVDERLQTGGNPIDVDTNALKHSGFTGLGSFFNDAQGRSIAIAWDNGDGIEPSVSMCPAAPTQLAPTAEAVIKPCLPLSGTNSNVQVNVTNTDDLTNASVTYTIVLGGQTKTLTLADGATGNVEFGGLTAGNYAATVTGTDGTVTTNSVTVVTCQLPIPLPLVPTATATIIPCTLESGLTDKVSVNVTNTDDLTNASVTYTIVLGDQTKTLTLADGASGNVEFGGLAVGSYTATVTGTDGTVTTNSVTVANCPKPVQLAPTALAIVVPCAVDSGLTDKVSVIVTNTDDATNAAVTYTIVLGGQTKTLTLADGATGNVEFGGLAAGNYTATVTGTDGTVTTNSVTVTMCDKVVPPVDVCPNVEGIQTTLPNGMVKDDEGNCITPGRGGDEEQKVTLCHATGSTTNPFVKITVSAAGAFNGHLGDAYSNGDHQDSRDIIPPFTFNGQNYLGQNWDTTGRAIFDNDCKVPAVVTPPVVTPPVVTPPTTPGRGGEGGETVLSTITLPVATTTPATTSATPTNTAPQLANTGASDWLGVIIGFTVMAFALSLGMATRRQTNY